MGEAATAKAATAFAAVLSRWIKAVQKACAALKIKGCAAIKEGAPLYIDAKEFYGH